jgi:hypothetical protein
LLSNWSGVGYTDDRGRDRVYDSAYFYQRDGKELTKRYPTFWAWPWVKIAVLPPIIDGSLTVNIGQQKEVAIEYRAVYDPDQLVGITEVFYSGSPLENKEIVDNSLRVIVRSQMEGISLPKEMIMLKKPLNTAFTDKTIKDKVDGLKKSITDMVSSKGLIIGVTITSVKFPT